MIDWTDIEKLLSDGKTVSIRVRGVSMYPSLFTDDIITLAPLQGKPQKEGIYFVKLKNSYAIHRFHHMKDTKIITKGDNLLDVDGEIEKLIGVVTKRKRTLTSLLKRLKYYFLKITF